MKLITIPEAARITGVCHVTIRRLVASGTLPSVEVSHAKRAIRRIPEAALATWAAGQKQVTK